MYIVQTQGREVKLMFKVVTWLYLMVRYRDVSRMRLFVSGLFVPNMQNARHLMFRPIICVCASFALGVDDVMLISIVIIPDHCLSVSFGNDFVRLELFWVDE